MASRYFGISRGQKEFDIVEGSSTNSTNVELVVDLAANVEKSELIDMLNALKNKILKSTYPPK